MPKKGTHVPIKECEGFTSVDPISLLLKLFKHVDFNTMNSKTKLMIKGLCLINCSMSLIASLFGVSLNKLKDIKIDGLPFPEYYTRLVHMGRMSLKKKLFLVAYNDKHKGQATMLIWLSKNIIGMTDQPQIEPTLDILFNIVDDINIDNEVK